MEKRARQALPALTIAVLTLIAAISAFWTGAEDDLKALGALCGFVSFVAWGVWLTAILSKKELKKLR